MWIFWKRKRKRKNKSKNKQPTKGVYYYNESDTITPFYINTDRLLDECAIRWDGYSTFTEVSNSGTTSKEVSGKASVSVGVRFLAWDVGPELAANLNGNTRSESGSAQHTTRIHTAASLLMKLIHGNQNIVHFEYSDKSDGQFKPCTLIGKTVVIYAATLEKVDINKHKEISEIFQGHTIFLQKLRMRIKKEYSKLNGIDCRSFLKVRFHYAGKDFHGYINLSRAYFYQSELDDILCMPMKYLVKVVDYQEREDMGFRFEVIAVYQ